MYLYICVHTWDPETSVSGPWPFCFKFPWFVLFHGHSTPPCASSWSGGFLLPCHSTSCSSWSLFALALCYYWVFCWSGDFLRNLLTIWAFTGTGFRLWMLRSPARRSDLQLNFVRMMTVMISTDFSIISALEIESVKWTIFSFHPPGHLVGCMTHPCLSWLGAGFLGMNRYHQLSRSTSMPPFFPSMRNWLRYRICCKVIFRWSRLILLLLTVLRLWSSFIKFHWSCWRSWCLNFHNEFESLNTDWLMQKLQYNFFVNTWAFRICSSAFLAYTVQKSVFHILDRKMVGDPLVCFVQPSPTLDTSRNSAGCLSLEKASDAASIFLDFNLCRIHWLDLPLHVCTSFVILIFVAPLCFLA